MSNLTFICEVCGGQVQGPLISLDRRIEKLTPSDPGSQTPGSLFISSSESLHHYCSHSCWQTHEPEVSAALKLSTVYPASGLVTPCSRCGTLVQRDSPYVCYALSEILLEGEDTPIGHCVDDQDFAVLCNDCEPPGPLAEASEIRLDELTLA